MFSLVITIIAIALVAVLALATLYFMGRSTDSGGQKAAASRILNEGSQVAGAFELYRANHVGNLPTGTAEEIKATLQASGYLSGWPTGEWDLQNDYAIRSDVNTATCTLLNKSLGIETTPSCSDPAFANRSVCCLVE